ncbi:MAG TPA: MBL fold metallo-hydrolase [Candidatus Limiplasma sp.]|nr:MBL fold metallo-hydrolase [Candidatus Limiplasma sp.]
MTTLRFYQGLQTIGGTIIEIQTDTARCLFDFGLIYNPSLDARVLARPDAAVYDGLKTGAIAPIEGLFDADALCGLPLKPYGQTQPKPFVLISHMHIDHMGALGALAEGVEVYLSQDSLRLYRGLRKIKEAVPAYHRNTIGLPPMRWKTKGDLRFRMIPVDHDVPGASGLEIQTPDGRICYTGDLRLHGRGGEKPLAFADTVRNADVCITEGTTVSFIEDFDAVDPTMSLEGGRSEAQVEAEIQNAAKANGGMVFINLYRRNVERVLALKHALQAAGRRFVMQYGTAVLFRQFYPNEPVAVFAPSLGTHVLNNAETIARDTLREHPERFALDLPYEHLLEALDYDPAQSLYIHSDGVPLGAYDPGYQKLQDFLAREGIAYQAIGCGGHARPAHLKYILTRIAPKTLVPLHSLTPEKMSIPGSKQLLPEAGMLYALSGGRVIKM